MLPTAIVVSVTPRASAGGNSEWSDPAKDMVKPEEMVVLDRWAVGKSAKAAQEDIVKAYESYDFMKWCSA